MEQSVDLSTLTVSDFLPHVNSAFAIRLESSEASRRVEPGGNLESLTLKLTAADPLPTNRKSIKREPFCLEFTGTPGTVLEQRIYALAHPQMGLLEIFIVPVGVAPEGTCYEAVFA
jgi:hypothetical protein